MMNVKNKNKNKQHEDEEIYPRGGNRDVKII